MHHIESQKHNSCIVAAICNSLPESAKVQQMSLNALVLELINNVVCGTVFPAHKSESV